MIYLFLGPDQIAKDAKIHDIKTKLLPLNAFSFDYEVLYSQKLDPETLKKALMALPAVAKERLVVVRECHKLTKHHEDLILEFLQTPNPCVLILESEKAEADNDFFKKIGRLAKIALFGKEETLNVFNMTRAIAERKQAEALKILFQLLLKGDKPLQIMGGMVWFWKNERRRLPSEKYKKGLLALQEADLNIKRSRLKEEHALELLVIKLSS